jgi:hypothetical protein
MIGPDFATEWEARANSPWRPEPSGFVPRPSGTIWSLWARGQCVSTRENFTVVKNGYNGARTGGWGAAYGSRCYDLAACRAPLRSAAAGDRHASRG